MVATPTAMERIMCKLSLQDHITCDIRRRTKYADVAHEACKRRGRTGGTQISVNRRRVRLTFGHLSSRGVHTSKFMMKSASAQLEVSGCAYCFTVSGLSSLTFASYFEISVFLDAFITFIQPKKHGEVG